MLLWFKQLIEVITSLSLIETLLFLHLLYDLYCLYHDRKKRKGVKKQ